MLNKNDYLKIFSVFIFHFFIYNHVSLSSHALAGWLLSIHNTSHICVSHKRSFTWSEGSMLCLDDHGIHSQN